MEQAFCRETKSVPVNDPADVVDLKLEHVVQVLVHAVVDGADQPGNVRRSGFLPARHQGKAARERGGGNAQKNFEQKRFASVVGLSQYGTYYLGAKFRVDTIMVKNWRAPTHVGHNNFNFTHGAALGYVEQRVAFKPVLVGAMYAVVWPGRSSYCVYLSRTLLVGILFGGSLSSQMKIKFAGFQLAVSTRYIFTTESRAGGGKIQHAHDMLGPTPIQWTGTPSHEQRQR